ncbi:hypothetical protein R77567_04425 [Ralstonia sp. LMG 32965]|uniref:Uncharacterized protein n=1 Tax=Ralstonia flatus TaxID=3058601 RepID=A0AAD2F723_9RALS|nr:hypothetical protein R77567_04425 [Ralstonia sp. LMG 32965]CAJ0902889.1 hypothetical protein R77564_04812 [Ralstonia sp. LMG 32965]
MYHQCWPPLAGLMQTRTLGSVNVPDARRMEQSFEEDKA